MLTLLTLTLGCSSEEAKPPAPPPAPPPVAAPPVPPPAPTPPPVPTGPYTPDDLAKAAYDKAKAAGADKKPNPKAGDAAAITAGKTVYETKACATCHGATGAGDGVAGAALPQKPGQFVWKERWQATTIGEKHWVVMSGIEGTAMAPLGLTEDEAWSVLSYIEATFVPK